MSFRKRAVVVGQAGSNSTASQVTTTNKALPPGLRPSPLDGRLTTSTGTHSLDGLLAGHAGLALGTSLLIEEHGTTDFAGYLTRYFAAEGVVQGHQVHVLGMHEGWGRELPGIGTGEVSRRGSEMVNEEKMKIAWRYERLGEFGSARERGAPQSPGSQASSSTAVFCHDFDLSKKLLLPSPSPMRFVPITTRPPFEFKDLDTSVSPFTGFLNHLSTQLSVSPNTVHRVVIPNLLSSALYPPESSRPEHVLQFLHGLRALLRKYPSQVVAIITLPVTLHPRTTGLTRWMELLSDGVLELSPFPSSALPAKSTPGAATVHEEPPQGMLKIHRLPIFHEKGGGGGEASGFGDDLAFTLSRRKGLVIKPFSLPPVEGDTEAQQGGLEHEHGKATKVDIEF
ncbi:PAXNEB-domain-containing protein [Mollisia scopiformis]|uniref:Elongator complex protein 4 n=1 Tax=Mollisia scopiformis TaxID=149040 RepID=A0A132B3B5_MOLSC|nr:PAXNEB-domain-containing protein [Mollisia scopiformis]KUJ06898.1 PAXNEB-domain-containing protein [Mollisia scopiformis]